MNFGREAPVHAEKLLVHEGGEGEAVERLHTCVVHTLRVLDLALLLEREVLREVPALVVSPQEEQCRRVYQF